MNTRKILKPLRRTRRLPARERSRVLIIDAYDEREMYAEALRASGFAVSTAATAAEALRDLDTINPDVVVQGVALPDRSGLELVRDIKARARSVPVIALTGFTDDRTLKLIEAAGFASVKMKPCLPVDLAREVVALVRGPARDQD